MARKVYIGNANVARNVKKIYVGVNGVARKVKKGYIGDSSGKARLFYTAETYKWNRYNITTTYKWNRYTVETYLNGTVTTQNISGSMVITWNRDPECFHRRLPRWSSSNQEWNTDRGSGTWGGVDPGDYISIDRWDNNGNNTIYEADREVEREWVDGELISTFYYSAIISCRVTETDSPGSLVGEVTSTSSGTYPSNGVSGSYWYVSNGSEKTKGSLNGTVESDNPNAYPADGISGNYWYTKIS